MARTTIENMTTASELRQYIGKAVVIVRRFDPDDDRHEPAAVCVTLTGIRHAPRNNTLTYLRYRTPDGKTHEDAVKDFHAVRPEPLLSRLIMAQTDRGFLLFKEVETAPHTWISYSAYPCGEQRATSLWAEHTTRYPNAETLWHKPEWDDTIGALSAIPADWRTPETTVITE